MNRIKKSNIDDKLIWIINDKYELDNLIYIYEDYVLYQLKEAINNKSETLKINLLGEIKIGNLLNFYEDKKELDKYLKNALPTNNFNISIRFELAVPTFGVLKKIFNEGDLIEVVENIKDIEDKEESVRFYYNEIKIKDLYKQFKGKDNFIKIYNHIKDILNDKTS